MKYDVTDFKQQVLERSKELPVVVDFWAEWCGPCRVLGPVLERLAAQSDGTWTLAKVNTEEMPDVAAAYNIRSIPNVKLLIDGKVKDEFVGALPEPMIRQWLRKNVPDKCAKEIERADELIAAGSLDEARRILSHVVDKEPSSEGARALLARTLVYSDCERAAELVRDIEEDSPHFDIAESVRTFASMLARISTGDGLPDGPVRATYRSAIECLGKEDFAGALEKFIDVIRNDRYYDDDGARKACIAIFKLLGEEHEVTRKYRREFSTALYR
jgi:putative thioredoxin